MCLLTFSASAQSEYGRQLYISPTGNNRNDGDSPRSAWRTFDKVVENLMPGDIVNIMPGTYSAINTPNRPLIDLKDANSGQEGNYITFRAYDPENRPKFRAGGRGVWKCVNINASYIIFDGIEMEGFNEQLDSLSADSVARDSKTNKNANWNEIARYNTNGVNIGGSGKSSAYPTHIIIRNCIVHDFPGGGIGAQQADYITFENNTVYNNAWYNMYACSGMSILNPFNSDDETGYKNYIVGNTIYNNHTKIKWYNSNDARWSDGNGIIIDVNKTPDPNASDEVKEGGAYKARTLVANNVCYFNGGSGIHSFRSQHVDIISNTTYMNQLRYRNEYGEIFSQDGGDNNIYNNIMYGKYNGWCTNYSSNSGVTYGNNIYYNGALHGNPKGGFKRGNPLFVHAPSSPTDEADFHLTAESPAIAYGISYDNMPATDKDGNSRSNSVDCGAYQFQNTTGITGVTTDNAVRKASDKRYNLLGQSVSKSYRGIIVSNGKKFIVK